MPISGNGGWAYLGGEFEVTDQLKAPRLARDAVVACGLLVGLTLAWGEAPPPATLTSVANVRSLSPEQAAARVPVRVRGVVTLADPPPRFGAFYLQDSTAGIYVEAAHPPAAVKAGQLVEVEGWSTMGGYAPNIAPARVRVVGTGALPEPKVGPYDRMAMGREAAQWVETRGSRSRSQGRSRWPHRTVNLS